jgi:hypothetical protein
MSRVIGAGQHGAELVKEKHASVHPDAFLRVENGPARIQFDHQRD